MAFYNADPIFFESISNVTTTNSVELGTLRMEGGEYYEYVYAVKTIPVGYGAVYSGTSGHSVIATGSVSGEHCAGFCKHALIPGSAYGWLLKRGVVDAKNGRASTAPVVNEVVHLSADGAMCSDQMIATSAIDGGHVIGKILSAGASGGTGASLSLLLLSVF